MQSGMVFIYFEQDHANRFVSVCVYVCVCVCVCVCARARAACVSACVRACVCVSDLGKYRASEVAFSKPVESESFQTA